MAIDQTTHRLPKKAGYRTNAITNGQSQARAARARVPAWLCEASNRPGDLMGSISLRIHVWQYGIYANTKGVY